MRSGSKLILVFFFLASTSLAFADTLTTHKGWNVRWGIAAPPDKLSALIGKSEAFSVEVTKLKDEASGENRVLGVGEAHGVYPVPLSAAVAAVLDYPNLKALSPRVREVRVLDPGPPRWHVYEDIGINFLGISVGYKLEVETIRDDLPGGAVGVRGRLVKSHDGKLYEADSSWYFARVVIGGVEYTYIRTYSTSGLREPGAGVAGIMKLFTSGDLRDQVSAVAKIAAPSRP